MNTTTKTYLLHIHPEHDEEVHVYTLAEMVEIFTEQERGELVEGHPVFKHGGFYASMVVVARAVIEEELANG